MQNDPMHGDPADDGRIRERAYAIWDREGRPEGRHLDHWEQARQELDAARAAAGPGAGVPVPDSASERALREAADRMRGIGAGDDTRAGRPSATDPHTAQDETWAGTGER